MGTSTGTIQNVSADLFSQKVTSSLDVLYQAFAPLLIPFVKLGILFSILIIISGCICCSKRLKLAGASCLLTTLAVIGLYYLLPLLAGLFKTAGQSMSL